MSNNVSNLKKYFEEKAVPKASDKKATTLTKPVKPAYLTAKHTSSTTAISNHGSHQPTGSSVKVKPIVPAKILTNPSNPAPVRPGKALQNPFLEEADPVIVSVAQENESSHSLPDIRKIQDTQGEPRSLKVPKTLVRKPSEEDIQRSHILKELYDSEASFLSDMKLLQSIYIFPAKKAGLFSAGDLELLFGNVDDIVKVSSDFLVDVDHGVKNDCVGPVFKKHVSWQYLF
jgi:hypothetical protein